MSDSELPESLLRLIRYCLPTFPAVELMVFIAGRPDVAWDIEGIIGALQPRAFTPASVRDYLTSFENRGLVEEIPAGRYIYRPASPALAEAVAQLRLAFNERPVTLIRNIYELADHPIQSFADSFLFKND